MYAKLKDITSSQLQTKLKLDPVEVGACTFVDKAMVKAIVAATDDQAASKVHDSLIPKTFT